MLKLRETIKGEVDEVPDGRVSAVQRLRPLRNAFVWLLTTAGGVVIGAVGTSYFERSSPVASIAEISITSQFNDRFGKKQTVKVPRDDPLFAHLDASDWLNAPEHNTTLDSLVTLLEDAKEQTNIILQQLDSFKTSEKDLRSLLSSPPSKSNAENFLDKWQLADLFIETSIFIGFNNGELPRQNTRDRKKKQQYLMMYPGDVDAQGVRTYNVLKPAGRLIYPIKALQHEQNDDAQAIAEALSSFDQNILTEYIDIAAKQLQSSFYLHEQIKKEVPQTLKSYSRWSVATLVSNSGIHAVSFSPTATLYIDTSGTTGIPGYTKIDLESRLTDEQPEPVEVEGSKSRLVHYVSKGIVRSTNNWQALLALFDDNSRRCFIVLHPQSDFWRKSSQLSSSVREFGPTKGEQGLTDMEIETHFRR